MTFSDGGTVTLDAHFSNFGCAGTVLMPGQGGVSTPPSGCVSADTGAAPTTSAIATTTTTSLSSANPDDRLARDAGLALHDDDHFDTGIHFDHDLDDNDNDIIDVDHEPDHDNDQLTITPAPLRRSSRHG